MAAGTTPLALVPQFDLTGSVAAGCLLYFFQAGTTATAQNIYSDFGLTQPLPNPLSCDQSGRVPMHWIADGLIHVRLTNASGSPILDTTLQTLGPSSGGGGGGGTVDPTTIFATGDVKAKYGTGPITGWVRQNGLTLGNATSGATERANADTQNLFIYLYTTDPNLVVSGGRTGNALNDYNASKTINLPDMRGRTLTALADMGNTATSVFTSTYASCNNGVTTLGSACGNQSATLGTTNLPPYTPRGSLSLNSGSLTGTYNGGTPVIEGTGSGIGGGGSFGLSGGVGVTISGAPGGSFSGAAQGGTSAPFGLIDPTMLITVYIKL